MSSIIVNRAHQTDCLISRHVRSSSIDKGCSYRARFTARWGRAWRKDVMAVPAIILVPIPPDEIWQLD